MEIVNLPLPEVLREFVDSEIAVRGYGDRVDCIQAVLRDAQKRRTREKVEAMLEEGLESGTARELTAQDRDNLLQEIRQRHERRNGTSQFSP